MQSSVEHLRAATLYGFKLKSSQQRKKRTFVSRLFSVHIFFAFGQILRSYFSTQQERNANQDFFIFIAHVWFFPLLADRSATDSIIISLK